MACIIQNNKDNFLRWSRVYGDLTIEQLQASGIPDFCDPSDLAPPTDLVVTSGLIQITLNWNDNTINETGYEIYRSTTSGFTPSAGNLLTLVGQVTTYADTTATVGVTYYYVIRAYNLDGFSAFSNEDSGQIFNAFTLTIDPDGTGTSGTTEFTLPISDVFGTTNLDIYNADTGALIQSGVTTASPTIDFGSSADITIAIVGTLGGFNFNNGGDKNKVLDILRVGIFSGLVAFSTNEPYSLALRNAANLTWSATDPITLSGDCFLFLAGTAIVGNSSFNNWDVSAVTSLRSFFASCTSLTGITTLNSWDLSSCTSLQGMFFGTPFNGTIGSWNTSTVTNMNQMFQNNTAFNQNIGSWDTSAVTDMGFMFLGATAFNQNIGGWDTSLVTTMESMFDAAGHAFNQDISGWNIQNVTTFRLMFDGSNFNQNLADWGVHIAAGDKLTRGDLMFRNASMSTANYTDTLVGWANAIFDAGGNVTSVNFGTQTGNTFDTSRSGGANFANAGAARTYLTTTLSWTISGDTVI